MSLGLHTMWRGGNGQWCGLLAVSADDEHGGAVIPFYIQILLNEKVSPLSY